MDANQTYDRSMPPDDLIQMSNDTKNVIQPFQKDTSASRPISPLPKELPQNLQRLLNTWYDEHGSLAVPPCANSYRVNHDPCQRSGALSAAFQCRHGDRMLAKRYPAGIKDKTVLVVKCKDFPPSIIKHWNHHLRQFTDGWYIWFGGELWEETPSVKRVTLANDVFCPGQFQRDKREPLVLIFGADM
jgi:hypothetical protein